MSSPVSSSNGDDGELGSDDGSSDGGSDLLSALDSKSDVSIEVSDGDEGLESGSLSSGGLLLNGGDVHDLVLEGGEEEVDDLELLDGEGEEVDLLHGLDLSVLDESSKLGDGDPGEVGEDEERTMMSLELREAKEGDDETRGRTTSRGTIRTHHSLSSSFRPPRLGPLRPRSPPRPPRSPPRAPAPPRPIEVERKEETGEG